MPPADDAAHDAARDDGGGPHGVGGSDDGGDPDDGRGTDEVGDVGGDPGHGRRRDAPADHPGSDEPLLVRARDVTHTFAGGNGVEHVDLDVPEGRIFGLVGPSGSGKTTVVRLVLGLIEPQEGSLEVFGVPPSDFTTRERTRIGYLPQASALDPALTLRHNLDFMASQYGLPWRGRLVPGQRAKRARARVDEVLDLVDLRDVQRTRLRDASGGEQRRLSIAAAIVHEPDLLVLDEPTAGIDPVLREQLWQHFGTLRDGGTTLFVTTQYVTEADACDLVALMVDGEMLRVDTPDGLRRTAFGGELVEVAWERDDLDISGITSLPGVRSLQRWVESRRLRLVVDSADDAVPAIQDWLGERGETNPVVSPHRPSFDEVFVRMVQTHRGAGGRRPLVAARGRRGDR